METKRRNRIGYNLMNRMPVARFYYQGKHSHPVRRTVLLIEEGRNTITGYELREGSRIRSMRSAFRHVKTYRKDRIARYGDYSRLRMSSQNLKRSPNQSTLRRDNLVGLLRDGV